MKFVKGMLVATMLLMVAAPAALAIDLALPSDIYGYDWEGDPAQVQPGVTMFTSWQESQDGTMKRGYAMGIDESGELVYFKQGLRNMGLSYWNPNQYENKHVHGFGHIAHSDSLLVLNDDMSVFHSISKVHPEHPDTYEMTSFEGVYDDEGTVWTLWFSYEEQDLSDLGGYENAIVEGQVIERRDLDGNLLWSWSSHDHMTGVGNDLAWEFMDNDDAYLEEQFRPLHINGYQITDSGDIVVSARFMSLIFAIDYPSGDILWRIGAGGEEDGNQFTYTGDADGHPLSFNRQHDPQFDETNETLTVFDNGQAHPDPRSYARKYQLDFDTMEAELIWYYVHEEEVFDSKITGSVRAQPNGNTLIGWGSLDPPVHATELNANDEVVWQVHFHDDPVFEMATREVRAVKWYAPIPSGEPYGCYVYHDDTQQVEIVANWFGHEDEVEAYDIYMDQNEDPTTLVGTSTDGYLFTDLVELDQVYYAKVQPTDADGNPLADPSEVFKITTSALSVDDAPAMTTLPQQITLAPAWPNPFNNTTSLNVNLPSPAPVKLQVFDVLGRQVATIHNGRLSAGQHAFTFTANDLASGVYFVRATAPDQLDATQKITLVR